MPKVRLDQLLVSRGLAQSRERARALILAGDVTADGRPATKAGTLIDEAAQVALRQPDHPWVGRGGIKLAHALDAFGVDVTGIVALDIGASTGGFTQVLLSRGASHVVALDVGHNQLDWRLRSDDRVTVLEGLNARHVRPDDLPEGRRVFAVVTMDVSFISLTQILPSVPPLLTPDGLVIALVKPQFEAGRDEVGAGGIVRDPAVQSACVERVQHAGRQLRLEPVAMEPSPVTGAEGNQEFFVLLKRAS